MNPDDLAAFSLLPDSEFEWEDLLLRLEMMPRALKFELESTRASEIGPLLDSLVARELFVGTRLEAAATEGAATAAIAAGTPSSPPVLTTREGPSQEAALDRFVRLRSRNFAMLQRRGIEVWSWNVRIAPSVEATVFQLLSLLARGDVEMLASLRRARMSGPAAC